MCRICDQVEAEKPGTLEKQRRIEAYNLGIPVSTTVQPASAVIEQTAHGVRKTLLTLDTRIQRAICKAYELGYSLSLSKGPAQNKWMDCSYSGLYQDKTPITANLFVDYRGGVAFQAFYKYKRVLRIYSGEQLRITNSIIQVLLEMK